MITPQEKIRAYNWLYDKGNPIIKLWAAERLGVPADELERLRADMLLHPVVQYWVGSLMSSTEKLTPHNSFDTCLENSMRKALLFGVREEDVTGLVGLNGTLLEKLAYQLEHPYWLNPVDYTIVASYLAAMGYADRPVISAIRERLESSLEFTALGGPDMYADPTGYPTIPKARRGHPLIDPKYNEGSRYRYPLVYDLFAYVNLPRELNLDATTVLQIDAVIHIALDERYQRLPWGYGLIFVPPNKYYGMGWSVHLPRYFDEGNNVNDDGSVWWAEAMARFPAAARSDWFHRMLEHLDGFRTKNGFWKFPAKYMTEGMNKYFVGGGHMGLGEDRKNRGALELESTTWMLRIFEAMARPTVETWKKTENT